MNRASEEGKLPLFLENRIFKDSGNNPVFKYHTQTHFPGSSVAFFILKKILFFVESLKLLQVFNFLFYFLVTTYFALLLKKHFKSRFLFYLFYLFIALGSFFSLFAASYTNQLFGLFLLLYFIDLNHVARKRLDKNRLFFEITAVTALIITYIYFLPIIGLIYLIQIFNLIKKAKKLKLFFKKNLKYFLILIFGVLIFSSGYIYLTIIKAELFTHALEGDPVPKNYLLLDAVFYYLLFFILLKIGNLKNIFNNQRLKSSVQYFLLPCLAYSILLMLAMLFGVVSLYPFQKSLFLSVPIFWFFVFKFLDLSLFDQKFNFKKIINQCDHKSKFKFKYYFFSFSLIVIFLPVIKEKLQTIQSTNADSLKANIEYLTFQKEKKPNINWEEIEFLKNIKKDYPLVFENKNQIMVLSSSERSLWVYVTTGIWPRPETLIPKGRENKGTFSPMTPFSREAFNYGIWLNNEKRHYLILLDQNEVYNWTNNYPFFDINNFNEIYSYKKNRLLHLKEKTPVRYNYQNDAWNDYEKYGISKAVRPIVNPYHLSGSFSAKFNNLIGMSFLISDQSNMTTCPYIFEFSYGSCQAKKELILKKEINNGYIKSKEYTQFFFDKIIKSQGQEFCFEFYQKGIKANPNLPDCQIPIFFYMGKNSGSFEFKQIYEFEKTHPVPPLIREGT
jgi:MFS family permease